MFINRYILNYCSLVHQGFSAHTGKASLCVSSPITTDDTSCFDASWLSIKTSWLFILHVKPSCCSCKMLRQLSWWLTSCIYIHNKKTDGGGGTHEWFENAPPHFCLKIVCNKGGVFSGAFRTLWWSPHYWWHTIAIWSNQALMLIVVMKDVNPGKTESPVSPQQRWWWDLHQNDVDCIYFLKNIHTVGEWWHPIQIWSYMDLKWIKFMQYQNMGITESPLSSLLSSLSFISHCIVDLHLSFTTQLYLLCQRYWHPVFSLICYM